MNYTERNRLIDRVCASALMIIFIEIFFAVVYSGFQSFKWVLELPKILIYVGIAYILIAIGLYIYSYLKKNIRKAIYGTEFLVLAIMTFLLPHSYVTFKPPFNTLHVIFPIAFLVYYIAKVVIIISLAFKKR